MIQRVEGNSPVLPTAQRGRPGAGTAGAAADLRALLAGLTAARADAAQAAAAGAAENADGADATSGATDASEDPAAGPDDARDVPARAADGPTDLAARATIDAGAARGDTATGTSAEQWLAGIAVATPAPRVEAAPRAMPSAADIGPGDVLAGTGAAQATDAGARRNAWPATGATPTTATNVANPASAATAERRPSGPALASEPAPTLATGPATGPQTTRQTLPPDEAATGPATAPSRTAALPAAGPSSSATPRDAAPTVAPDPGSLPTALPTALPSALPTDPFPGAAAAPNPAATSAPAAATKPAMGAPGAAADPQATTAPSSRPAGEIASSMPPSSSLAATGPFAGPRSDAALATTRPSVAPSTGPAGAQEAPSAAGVAAAATALQAGERGAPARGDGESSNPREARDPGPDAIAPAADASGLAWAAPGTFETALATASAVGETPAGQPAVERAIDLRPDEAGFGAAFARQVGDLADAGLQSASFQLNPEALGPLHIALQLDGQNLSVSITAPQAETREAIERSIDTLRTTLAERGLELADWRLSADAGGGRGGRDPTPRPPSDWRAEPPATRLADGGERGFASRVPTYRGDPASDLRNGRLDLYA